MRTYDTTGYINTHARAAIIIDGKEYKADISHKNFMRFAKQLDTGAEDFEKAFEIAFGKEQAAEIDKLGLDTASTLNLIKYITAAMQGKEYEEVEKEFFRSEPEDNR